MRASSEAESRSRGVSGPRARRSLTRGGVQPSSEAGPLGMTVLVGR
jgi:hypothetical protein